MKRKLLLIFLLVINGFLFAQETYVPDDNFEAFLEANGMGNGIANDDHVTTSAVANVTVLAINNQGISDLTGLQDFSMLTTINCSNNNITSLDLSFKRIFNVLANDNALTYVNMKNGFNADVNAFDVTNNPDLFCIEVDDASSNVLLSWSKDATARFKDDCTLTYVPDDNFENYLETHDADGNVVAVGDATSMGNGIANDDHVSTSKIAGITDLDISGLPISDATGIEDFIALQNLNCFNNSLSSYETKLQA